MSQEADMSRQYRVGWIGQGAMGRPMCERVIAAGHEVRAYARSGVVPEGVTSVETPAAVCEGADLVITMVGGPDDVEQIYSGDHGLFEAQPSGVVLADMTTSSPDLARRLHDEGQRFGVEVLDAPVSGGPTGAVSGRLSIMVGGNEAALARAQGLFALLGDQIVHHGPAGSGQSAKAVNQVMVGLSMLGIVEAFGLALQSQLDMQKVLQTVGNGVAGSPLFEFMWPRLQRGDMDPGFKAKHMIKDLILALEQARNAGAFLPGTAALSELYRSLDGTEGGMEQGTQALVKVLYGDAYL